MSPISLNQPEDRYWYFQLTPGVIEFPAERRRRFRVSYRIRLLHIAESMMMTHLLFLLAMLVSASASRFPPNSAALHSRRRTHRFDVGGLRCRVLAYRSGPAAIRSLFRDASAKVRSESTRRTSLRTILANLRNRTELMMRKDVMWGSTTPLIDGRSDLREFGGRGFLKIRLIRARGGKYDATRALTSTIVLLRRTSHGQGRIRMRRELFAVIAGIGNVQSASRRDRVVVTRRARARQSVGPAWWPLRWPLGRRGRE